MSDHYGYELIEAREQLGISRDDLAALVGVSRPRTIRMWEERDEPVPADVWAMVDALLARQDADVDDALDAIGDAGDVRLGYWTSQEDYEAHGGRTDWHMANATARRIAAVLEGMCVDVEWVPGGDPRALKVR